MSVITPLYRTAVASNRIPVVANLIVSNVPGPQMPLYLAGAELKTYYPVSIVTHGLALNITIQSYAGALYYGLIACKKTVPNLRAFAAHIQAAHEELAALAAADETLAKPPVATRKPASRRAPVANTVSKTPRAKTLRKPTAKSVTKKPIRAKPKARK
jgi:hypothetical protein